MTRTPLHGRMVFVGDKPTDRPTDHDSRSLTIGGAQNSVIVYGYDKYLLQ